MPLHQDCRLAKSGRRDDHPKSRAQHPIEVSQKVLARNKPDLMSRCSPLCPYEPAPLLTSFTGSAAYSWYGFRHRLYLDSIQP